MISKILVGVSAVVMVLVLLMAVFGVSYIAHPKFTVFNKSTFPVMITVGSDGKDRHYGVVESGKQIKFVANLDAEMILLASQPDGNTLASPLMSLSSGTLTKATIFDTHIELE